MSMWKFQQTETLEDLLLSNLGDELIIPGGTDEQVIFFHNGDRLTVDLKTGITEWEPIKPGEFGSSRLSMRFHQWFGKGLIRPMNEGEA